MQQSIKVTLLSWWEKLKPIHGVFYFVILLISCHFAWKMAFVELKAPGKKPRPLQLKRKRMLERLGFPVYVVDNIEQIGGILDEIQST